MELVGEVEELLFALLLLALFDLGESLGPVGERGLSHVVRH